MTNGWIIFRRELAAYFITPMAFVFITIFVALTGSFTFYIGRFFDRGQATLEAFFSFHPWLYLILIPAISMRLWADERKTGSIEQLLTLPITTLEAVVGKFFAAWFFTGVALFLTFPLWLTVIYLGDPDNGVIAISYLGSFLMAGSFLAIGSCMSALTRNQVIAFILASTVCFVFTMSGIDLVLDFFRVWAPDFIVRAMAASSFLVRFESLMRGVLNLSDIVFFVSLTTLWLFGTVVAVDMKKAA